MDVYRQTARANLLTLVCPIRTASKSEATCKIRAIRAIRVQEKTHIIRVNIIDHESHGFHEYIYIHHYRSYVPIRMASKSAMSDFFSHIFRYLRGEETRRSQKKQISGGGKNKGSKFAAEKGSLLARVSFRAAREISHGALAKSKREILHDVQDDRDKNP